MFFQLLKLLLACHFDVIFKDWIDPFALITSCMGQLVMISWFWGDLFLVNYYWMVLFLVMYQFNYIGNDDDNIILFLQ